MLDLRQLREDPEPARAALARRGVDPAILDEALELDERRRALLPELEELRRAKNEASKRIGELQRSGADASEAIAEVRSASGREKELSRGAQVGRGAPLGGARRAAEPARSRRAARRRGAARGRRAGRRGARPRGAARRPRRPRGGSAGRGLALRLSEGSGRAAAVRARPVGARPAGREGLHAGGAARARARAALFGTGMLPDTEQQIYTHPRRRAVPRRHLGGAARVAPRRRDPRPRRAAAPLRGHLDLLPPRGGRRRQGHARHLPRPPVRQGGDVLVRRAGARRRGARAAARDRGGDPRRARAPVPRREHRRRRPRRIGCEEVRPRGLAARTGPLPRADLHLQHDRLPGQAARHPPAPGRGRRRRATCTPSTARRWRSAGRSSRSSRTTSGTTAASRSQRCCIRTARPSGSLRRAVPRIRAALEGWQSPVDCSCLESSRPRKRPGGSNPSPSVSAMRGSRSRPRATSPRCWRPCGSARPGAAGTLASAAFALRLLRASRRSGGARLKASEIFSTRSSLAGR